MGELLNHSCNDFKSLAFTCRGWKFLITYRKRVRGLSEEVIFLFFYSKDLCLAGTTGSSTGSESKEEEKLSFVLTSDSLHVSSDETGSSTSSLDGRELESLTKL